MYTKEDFLLDPEFIKWVKNPNKELDLYWSNWVEVNPGAKSQFFLAREIALGIKFQEELEVTQAEKDRILTQILIKSGSIDKRTEEIKNSRYNFFSWKWLKVAAMIVFAVSLGYLMLQVQSEIKIQPQVLVEKITNVGEKRSFGLPDGTRVWLNSNSSLTYPEQFSDSVRMVELVGEAFFEVYEDKARPFKVKSRSLITTALGTSFNIKSTNSSKTVVALVTGSVSVSEEFSNIKNQVLMPFQKLDFEDGQDSFKISSFNPDSIIGWKDGKLVFEHDNLDQVIEKLESWYGVQINLNNRTAKKWKFSGEYANQSLEVVLKSMSFIEDFKFEINDKQVTITF
ncbi:DUF4974 domain-containing protein [Belliella sp. DSM 111904]|uniref:DUF4974 domain-containing protein n=1 Tax=Belliella filtrata TaxID=2923435 RepID=A0ABS9UX00_9BACT|nr:FecR family protein [Belliella filtrata]MCH7408583.1 DUF4974 domain-containing protein [Belliella filtrata]